MITAKDFRNRKGSLAEKITGTLFSEGLNLGTITDTYGIALSATLPKGAGIFTELPATGTALAAGVVIQGTESRLVVNKDQTPTNDTSLYALSGHLRVKQDLPQSSCFGIWGYFEQSGTVAGSFGGALRAKVEGDAGLTMASLFGVHIDGAVLSGASVTNFPAIKVATDIEGVTGMKPWTTILEVGTAPSEAYFKLPDDGAMAGDTAASPLLDIQGTASAGFIKVIVGSATRYIPLYAAKSS